MAKEQLCSLLCRLLRASAMGQPHVRCYQCRRFPPACRASNHVCIYCLYPRVSIRRSFPLQAPNLGGGLYQNNRTGGVSSCIFANNTVTLAFSGQVCNGLPYCNL